MVVLGDFCEMVWSDAEQTNLESEIMGVSNFKSVLNTSWMLMEATKRPSISDLQIWLKVQTNLGPLQEHDPAFICGTLWLLNPTLDDHQTWIEWPHQAH